MWNAGAEQIPKLTVQKVHCALRSGLEWRGNTGGLKFIVWL
jgi:hypothetical protein